MENDSTINNRTLTLKRTFNVPNQLAWDAWSQPGHIAKWWGPKGMETRIIEHNFEIGGHWEYAMLMPDGREFSAEGTYSVIHPLERIVTTADFKPMTEGVVLEILFMAKGDTTAFIFNVLHPTAAYAQQQEKMGFYNGWGSTFDRLETYLNSESVSE